MKSDSALLKHDCQETSCGKTGCIMLYTGEHCFFCGMAHEVLESAVEMYGLASTTIHEVDMDNDENREREPDVTGLPTIKICDEIIQGLPQEQEVKDAVMRALMKDCFCE